MAERCCSRAGQTYKKNRRVDMRSRKFRVGAMPLHNIQAVHQIAECHSLKRSLANLCELTLVGAGIEKDFEPIAK